MDILLVDLKTLKSPTFIFSNIADLLHLKSIVNVRFFFCFLSYRDRSNLDENDRRQSKDTILAWKLKNNI